MQKVKTLCKNGFQKIGIIVTSLLYGTYSVQCDNIFDTANTALKSITTSIVTIGKTIFPLGIVICVISLFIFTDERKISAAWKVLIGMCVAYALLLLANSGALGTTIEEYVG